MVDTDWPPCCLEADGFTNFAVSLAISSVEVGGCARVNCVISRSKWSGAGTGRATGGPGFQGPGAGGAIASLCSLIAATRLVRSGRKPLKSRLEAFGRTTLCANTLLL